LCGYLEELGASIWADVGDERESPFDAIASFVTEDQKSRIAAIEVKPTEQPVGKEFHFQANLKSIRALQQSNVPVLFLVVDVKRSQIFYGWARDLRYDSSSPKEKHTHRCTLPVVSAQEGKEQLLKTIRPKRSFPDVPVLASTVLLH
jgi:hypothetical protein